MYRKNVKLLSIFNFLIGFSLFAPLAIIYFSKVSGSYTLGTSIFGITMLSSAIFEVPTGIWSDQVGRRGTVILGSWARLLAFIFYALGFSYWWLVIGAILEGLSRAFYSGNNDALLYDTLADSGKQEDYDEYLGKIGSTEQLALGISGIIGGVIATFSFPVLMWSTAAMQGFLLIVSYLMIEPHLHRQLSTNIYEHTKEAIKLFIHNRKLRLLSLSHILGFGFGEAGFQFRSAFVSMLWPLWAIGFSNVLSNLGATISFYWSGKLIKKFTAIKLLIVGSIYGKAINLLAYSLPNFFSPILLTSTSLFFGCNEIAKTTLMQREFTNTQRATMSSLNSLMGSISFAIITLVLGIFADKLGPATALIILTICSIPVTYIYYLIFAVDKSHS